MVFPHPFTSRFRVGLLLAIMGEWTPPIWNVAGSTPGLPEVVTKIGWDKFEELLIECQPNLLGTSRTIFFSSDGEESKAESDQPGNRNTGRGVSRLSYLPKIVLCIPGNWPSQEGVKPFLENSKVEFEFRDHDARMASAFRSCLPHWRSSLTDADSKAIDSHSSVLYILSGNFPARDAARCSHHLMQVGQQLLEIGGIGIKCDSSGNAHSAKHWSELTHEANAGFRRATDTASTEENKARGRMTFWQGLFDAYVALPISDDRNLYSCGLHLLGIPDLIVSNDVLSNTFPGTLNEQALEACNLFAAFALYLLAECPEDSFQPGNTFRTTATSPRFRVSKEPCTGYEEDDFFFNPYGRWRFENGTA